MLSSKILTAFLLVASFAINSAVAYVARAPADTQQYKNAVYYADWDRYQRTYFPDSMPASSISQVFFAFAKFDSNGTVSSADPGDKALTDQLKGMKSANPGLEILLSIGGWTASPNFPAMASQVSARQNFAATAVTLMTSWGMDGLDLDWEWPHSAEEAAAMLELIEAMRTELDTRATTYPTAGSDNKFTLSISLPVAEVNYQFMDLVTMDTIVDQFNVQAYDFAGSFSEPQVSGHAANLQSSTNTPAATPFNTDTAITYFLAHITPSKITLGMPLYGRSFTNTDGLGQPFNGVGPGERTEEPGIWDYKALPKPGATVHYDDQAVAAYSYDSAAKELISYDTPQSVQAKVRYLKSRGLGGAMFWEASGDKTGDESLVVTAWNELGMGTLEKSRNMSYPRIYPRL